MKIIFLDIDGVLNYSRMPDDDRVITPSGALSLRAIELLNGLTNDTGAKIVLSSTWRLDPHNKAIDSLIRAGVKGDIVGKTPNGCHHCLRGNEIRWWIMDNTDLIGQPYYDFAQYVILDDDSDMLLWQAEHYLHVDPTYGMTPITVYKAQQILGKFV